MATWSWQENDGRWYPYDQHISSQLEQCFQSKRFNVSLNLSGRGSAATHSVDLKLMQQTNSRTGTMRPMQRLDAGRPTSARGHGVWEWFDDSQWVPYGADIAGKLNTAQTLGDQTVRVTLRGAGYIIDLVKMVQVNERTHMQRRIRISGSHCVRSSSSAAGGGSSSRRHGAAGSTARTGAPDLDVWQWADDHGRWQPFEWSASQEISRSHTAGHPSCRLRIGRWDYLISFSDCTQTNVVTGASRPVAGPSNIPPGGMAGAVTDVVSGVAGAISGAASAAKEALSGVLGGLSSDNPRSARPGSAVPQLPFNVLFLAMDQVSDLQALTKWKVLQPGEWAAGATDPVMFNDLGEDGEEVVRLPCHTSATDCTFNRSTLEQAFTSKSCCPLCNTAYGLRGPQPSGSMTARLDSREHCEGHGRTGTIIVEYDFPSGTQTSRQPQPGRQFRGTQRKCYYPHDAVGWAALALLRTAFEEGALFVIGSSKTTGAENAVVWAIHQKTKTHGGPPSHGWPDPEYLDRLRSECAAANVTGALGEDHVVGREGPLASSTEPAAASTATSALPAPPIGRAGSAPTGPASGSCVDVKLTDPFSWRQRIDSGERGVIFVWGANMDNYARPEGEVIGGSSMAGPEGPTRGIAREFYVGMPTSKVGLSSMPQLDQMLACIDATVDTVAELLKSGKYVSVEFPADVTHAGARQAGVFSGASPTSSFTTGLGRGLGARQNGPYQPMILDRIDAAVEKIRKLPAPQRPLSLPPAVTGSSSA